MQDLQNILSPIVPAWAGVWQPSEEGDTPPEQFVVYMEQVTEVAWADDEPIAVERTATVKLWSTTDPTATAAAVRAAMRGAGWSMTSERTGGTYDSGTHRYGVNWTFTSAVEVIG